MPFLKLSTSISINTDRKPKILNDLSGLIAKETGKPEHYVMIYITDKQDMLFSGSSAPLAYLECKSIGLNTDQAKRLSKSLCEMLHVQLGLSPDRIYIEFSNCRAEYWGWNGSTFGSN